MRIIIDREADVALFPVSMRRTVGACRHSQIQTGVGTKATESQHQEDSMR